MSTAAIRPNAKVLYPVALVFLPFAAGYYLSYLFRTINALIAPSLITDLSLDAGTLGLMTSAYFLTFAAVQLPLGVLLDRFGPRRLQGVLLLVAAAGAGLFSVGEDAATLVLARGLIGLGVAGALMAGLKAIALWFPKERLALVNGWFVMIGTAGAITATAPAEMLLAVVGWRELFIVLAAGTMAVSALILVIVPEKGLTGIDRQQDQVGLREIYASRVFWRLAPLSASCIGTAWAVQGLWAAPWLSDVGMMERSAVVSHLFVMACTLSGGALLLGFIADGLRRRGVSPSTIFGVAAVSFVGIQWAILLRAPVPSLLLWGAFSIFGAMTVLSFAILGNLFPKESAGRANCALNVLHVGGAFLLQYAIGAIVSLWPQSGGRYPQPAYEAAFAFALAIQIAALLWYLRPQHRPTTASPDARGTRHQTIRSE